MCDLSDTITDGVDYDEGATVCFALATKSRSWKTWSEENLQKIEQRIRYDLEFDGFSVNIERVIDEIDLRCSEEFTWELHILYDSYEEDTEDA